MHERAMDALEGECYVHVRGEEGGLCPHWRGKGESYVHVGEGRGRLCPRWRGKVKAMSTLEREGEGYVQSGGGKGMSDLEREGYVKSGGRIRMRPARKTRTR
jgi:hypothetical protein